MYYLICCLLYNEFPRWVGGKESACHCRRHRFNPWVREIPGSRKWQHPPVLLPGESRRQRNLLHNWAYFHSSVLCCPSNGHWFYACLFFFLHTTRLFFMLTIFKLFTELVTILLLFYVLFYFVPELCGILVPRPGIESSPPALEGKVLTTGPPGKSLHN